MHNAHSLMRTRCDKGSESLYYNDYILIMVIGNSLLNIMY